ncbi:MAG: Glu-tRNA(Gln) amidotransferase subunit GatE [Candidatus Kariarchaeaceae archaeon]|jgi:glutamyl-tRNA(Gln) amidotransferase subunit E
MAITTKAPASLDFEKEGLKVGLEFHQQLFAPYNDNITQMKHGSKLFCPCPALLRDDEPDIKIIRNFRAVSGETGDIDISAAFERMKQATTIYEAYDDSTCLIELDEEPILPINNEALFRALAISKNIFNLELVDEILINRKTIIDGSNTSGFQRTTQIAYGTQDSYIMVGKKKISVYQANLEEDSAKNTGKEGSTRKFRLDRLGIPLIEIATGPDMRHPEEVLPTASRIGELLRTTGFVKRGQGTIRQDLNVSIKRGTRIEVKGVSELELLPTYVTNEAIRQSRMLELLQILKERKLTKRKINSIKPVNVTTLFNKCKAKFVKSALKREEQVIAAKIPHMAGLLAYELQPDYRFGTEISEICKVTAGVGGILHSDELPKFGITQKEVDATQAKLKLHGDDAFIMIIGPQRLGELSIDGVKNAFNLWLTSKTLIPEVRSPKANGTTGYLRPLPGKARMYPETDARPLKLNRALKKRIDSQIFEMPEERTERYVKDFKLSKVLADQLAIHPQNSLFEDIVSKYKVKANLVATTILSTMIDLRRQGLDVDKISDEQLDEMFSLIADNKLTSDAIEPILTDISQSDRLLSIPAIIAKLGLERIDETEILKIVSLLVKENLKLISERGMGSMGTLMRLAMDQLGGKADGKIVSNLVRQEIQKVQ